MLLFVNLKVFNLFYCSNGIIIFENRKNTDQLEMGKPAKKRKKRKPLYIRIITNRKFILFILIVLSVVFFSHWIFKSKVKGISIDYMKVDVLTVSEEKALKKYSNAYHLETAQKHGITVPFKSKKEMLNSASAFMRTYDLVLIDDNKYYEVPGLTHSLAYLKSDAKDFLDDLGEDFQHKLKELGLRSYRFSVTSILRTLDDQKGLRKSNINATDNNSAHYYGLTFDLSQTRFFESGDSNPIYSYRLRNILLRELIRMQNEGRCYVLLEKQTKCIHITVRKKQI
ncbi:MAG TPA: hypothetical protein DCG75_18185 [Bacteroidales bacterium]|nr:hypothetical protein [Bacteroidales bacterium]